MKNLFVVFILLFSMCSKDTVTDSSSFQRDQSNGAYVIKINEEMSVGDSLSITLNAINDTRCLKEACVVCFGSEAELEIIAKNSNTTDTLNIGIIGCIDGVDDCETCGNPYQEISWGDKKIYLLKLSPYPDNTNSPVVDSLYRATIKII
jgi:hypothetical protein